MQKMKQVSLSPDNTTAAIVLAGNSIVSANTDERSDLFWAFKGGGPNFGIFTRFDLYTAPVSDVWSQLSLFSPDQASQMLDAFAQWQSSEDFDIKSSVTLSIGLDFITLGLLYSTPAESPSVFAPFYLLEPLQVLAPAANGTMSQIYDAAASIVTSGSRRHGYRAASSQVDGKLCKSVHSLGREQALKVRETTGANQTFALRHVSRSLVSKGIERGGNPMGIPVENHQWWITLADWVEAEDDDLVRSVAIETADL
ncbi:Uu.00g008990.m01.CDS01 [Anthostomella pinea]|uniref:Uu.00g008990.m01.CDS01 n=1 Tax=Anthostomella pinea TaxID=933095 RepID=A0AAI8VY70_9PEZI|nr:Uu.00g008990.m01.CDS01 [Anthostomella pinea]